MRQPVARTLQCVVLAALLLSAVFAGAADKPAAKDGKDRHTNRLAKENSPYLLQHAHNPVDWYPWCPEAFAKAKKEGKLVFLSIGYSSCHWCHVMEKESFANPEVAKLLNDWFVCIKVDREERPDIDNIYMTGLQVLGSRGGWPLSMFLTADGKPVVGGTYWPPEDREIDGEKVKGFKSILKVVHEYYRDNSQKLLDQADKVAAATAENLAGANRGIPPADLDRSLATSAIDRLKAEFDKEHGGFGSPGRKFQGTKFPTPPYLVLVEYESTRTKSAELAGMLNQTLDHMARGGIYDHLGGGFHRYSTERTWTVPHFEKMLYDNAQLVELYARAYARTKNPANRQVVAETLAFIRREMTSPEGVFYSALDADSEGEEGRFYVWTAKEVVDVLTDKPERAPLKHVYLSDGKPNFESKFILRMSKSLVEQAKELKMTPKELEEKLDPLRKRLLAARAKRPRPFLDTKVLTAWNGQMIAAYAIAAQCCPEEKQAYTESAAKAANFILKNLRTKEGRLLRTYGARPGAAAEARLNGYLDDYAYLVHGLLCLHDATNDKKWLDEAKALTDVMVKFHLDGKDGGFFYTSSDHEKLFARSKDQYDGAQPSGNSMAARDLVRLWTKTGDKSYQELAEKSFKAFGSSLKASPTSMTALAEALGMYLDTKEKPKEKSKEKPKQEPKERGQFGPEPEPKQAVTWKEKSKSMVQVSLEADEPDEDGSQVVNVTLDINPACWLIANPPGIENLSPAETRVRVAAKPEQVQIEYPKGTLVQDEALGEYRIYKGQVRIAARVRREEEEAYVPLEITVIYQPMDHTHCYLPASVTLEVPGE